MRQKLLFIALALLATGCSSGAGGTLPGVTTVPPTSSGTLAFAVGTARYTSGDGISRVAFNTVETLRQANGLSAVLFSVPSITGPANFIVRPIIGPSDTFAAILNQDLGTNRITMASLPPGTGAFGYGLCACNANAAGASPVFVSYALPLFDKATRATPFYGGPPAFPTTRDGIHPSGFLGYPLGFTDFAVTPVTGSYRLDVAVPPDFTTPVNATTPTLSATASLVDPSGLPTFPAPVVHPDGTGGAAIDIAPPAGVTETMVLFEANQGCVSPNTPVYYTLLTQKSGPQTLFLPDALGPVLNANPTPSLCRSAFVRVYAVGFDYPAYEAAYPASTSQTPTIAGAAGQADITVSPVVTLSAP
jgi:hypothetical protein